jgi:uncharacterized protein (DUF608 family)
MSQKAAAASPLYRNERLQHIGFPLGGIGAGMICLEGGGSLAQVSLRHRPQVFHEPALFAALAVKTAAGVKAKVLEGPVPARKVFGSAGAGNGGGGRTWGLPRFESATFRPRFPFATVKLEDKALPVKVQITGWSPFIPNAPDDSSLPAAALEYRIRNVGVEAVEGVWSFHAVNFLSPDAKTPGAAVRDLPGGFILHQDGQPEKPWMQADFCARVVDPEAMVQCRWFRGGWFDPLTMLWRDIAAGNAPSSPPFSDGEAPSPGGSVFVPFRLEAGASRTFTLMLTWHVPESDLRFGGESEAEKTLPLHQKERYRPWYAANFATVREVSDTFAAKYRDLRRRTRRFSDCFYDSTLPPEVTEAVAANLTILKSPTVLRQVDGRIWAWEGCCDDGGCCNGTCTHVWNYAQALPHLFPGLERSIRETEFRESQDERGHQNFRAALPIRPTDHEFHAAADGQLGGLLKLHRDWRISGDTTWLRSLWPQAKASLDYCIATWDPDRRGLLREPHHNTYDIEFWGPDGMCNSFYLGALRAAVNIGRALGEPVAEYETLAGQCAATVETELFNGEYFFQRVEWQGLRAPDPTVAQSFHSSYSPEAETILRREGPKYQYGTGCLADGVLGDWLARVCGVGPVLDRDKVGSHLRAVHRHNLRHDLSDHPNPQRPTYAIGKEGGLILCTWPNGNEPALPFPYSNEVWTGYEYQVAAHLIMEGMVEEGLEIVRIARERYDGRVRNPFNEYECGHWYARAMSSYSLLQACSGLLYDAVDQVLYVHPAIPGDFRSFLCTAGGYGTAGIREGKPFLEVVDGVIPVRKIVCG